MVSWATAIEEKARKHKWASPKEADLVMWLLDEMDARRQRIITLEDKIRTVVEGFRALKELEETMT